MTEPVRRVRRIWRNGLPLAAIALVLAASALTLAGSAVGLTATVWPSGATSGAAPIFVERDAHVSSRSVERMRARTRGQPIRIRWDGYLYARETRDYHIEVAAPGAVSLWVDAKPIFLRDRSNGTVETSARLALAQGQHLITIEHEPERDIADLRLLWDLDAPRGQVAIPASVMSPVPLSPRAWALRTAVPALLVVSTGLWLAMLALMVWRAVRRAVGASGPLVPPGVRLAAAALAILFATGLTWGLPGPSWALDEMGAAAVIDGLNQRFSGGWTDKYPPLQYYVLALAYTPTLAAEHSGLVSRSEVWVQFVLDASGRTVGLLMAVGAVALLGVLGERLIGRGRGWLATASAGLCLPFVYYAKTANLDGPYVFWFVASLLFLDAAHRFGRMRDYVGLAITAVLAIGTKDQAYGLYVLPLLHLAWTSARGGRGRELLAAAAAGAVAFAMVFNLPFNFSGFLGHIDAMTGPASANYRMFPATLDGLAHLAWATLRLLGWSLGAAGVVAVGIGVITSAPARARDGTGSRARIPLWVWLVPLSYCLTFLGVVGYVYDRFLLPVIVTLALVAAAGLSRMLAVWPERRVAPAMAVALLAFLSWRAWSLNLLMLRDSRLAAEAWLQDNLSPGTSVAAITMESYLPRVAPPGYQAVTATRDATLASGPDLIVVNVEWMNRFPPDSPRQQWLRWLEAGDGEYQEVFRYKAPLTWSALRWDRRFGDRVEDMFTNLDKINPEIAIFRRRP